jgi:hypothetical protein
VSIHRSFAIASLISNTFYAFLTLSAGFLVNITTMPVYVKWLSDVNFIAYGFRIMFSNEFRGRTFETCTNPQCVEVEGEEYITTLGVSADDYLTQWSLLAPSMLFFYLGALCLLVFGHHAVNVMTKLQKKYDLKTRSSKVGPAPIEGEADDEDKSKHLSSPCQMSIKISLIDVSLSSGVTEPWPMHVSADDDLKAGLPATPVTFATVRAYSDSDVESSAQTSLTAAASSPSSPTPPADHRAILHHMTAQILPGRLTAIMGGSGSGYVCGCICDQIWHAL